MGTKRKSYEAVYLASYRRQNPEKSNQWRINSEINHLQANGYEVTKTKTKERPKQPEEMTLAELEERVQQAREQNRRYCRKWREKNREHRREYLREYRRLHPEKFKSCQSTEKYREYKARWRAKHRDEINAYQRKWSKDRRERIKKALEQARREQEGSDSK